MSINQPAPRSSREVLKLNQPVSVAIYDDYSDAARAVDYLADRQFPVENLAIVGTDLKSIEKVTGNMTWGRVLGAGFFQGSMWAGMFAVFMWMMNPGQSLLTFLAMAIAGFGLVGMAMAAFQYRARRGERDYTSTTAIIATHYEVLAESTVADRARHLLGGGTAHQTRAVEAHPPAQSVVAPPAPPVDLGTLPPPFGQQPSQAAPAAVPAAAPAPPPVAQPAAEPAQPAAPESAANAPYGQYWSEDDPQGIGDAPAGEGPSGFERPRRTDESQ